MKNIKNKEIEPYNNIYLGMHATFSNNVDYDWGDGDGDLRPTTAHSR